MSAKGFTHESTYNESKEWYTPREIFRGIGIDFDLDPCSPGQDIVPWIPAQIHYTVREDGLTSNWFGNVFMNPPYGSDTPKWMRKLSSHGNGIALVFARPDTQWFHKYVPLADAILFIRGRVAFIHAATKDKDYPAMYADGLWQPKGGCGAASMLVAFGKKNAEALLNSNLGFALPVIKSNSTDVQDGRRFMGDTSAPNENPSPNTESGRGSLFGEIKNE
jgi:hypothetical protein